MKTHGKYTNTCHFKGTSGSYCILLYLQNQASFPTSREKMQKEILRSFNDMKLINFKINDVSITPVQQLGIFSFFLEGKKKNNGRLFELSEK